MTGIIRSYEIKKNRDGLSNVLMLNVEISGPDDIQSVEYMSSAGDNHIPSIGSVVTILQAGRAWKIAIASNNQSDFDSSLNESERIISAHGGAYVKWSDDGTIELVGNTDFAVAFNDLKSGFDQLKSDFNSHTHAVTTAPGTTAVPTVPSTATIDGAKVTEVLLP